MRLSTGVTIDPMHLMVLITITLVIMLLNIMLPSLIKELLKELQLVSPIIITV